MKDKSCAVRGLHRVYIYNLNYVRYEICVGIHIDLLCKEWVLKAKKCIKIMGHFKKWEILCKCYAECSDLAL